RGRLSAATRSPGGRPARSAACAKRSAVAWRLVDVAVGDRHSEVLLVAIALGQVLGDGNRAVPATRAADRDHQVRATLGDVLREQEVQQAMKPVVEVLQAAVAPDV